VSVPDLTSNDYVYGDVVGAHHVDDLLIEVVDMWFPGYIREVYRRSGENPDKANMFRSHRVSHELEKMPEDQSPGLILVNLGLTDAPLKQGTNRPGKTYYATWRYQVGILTSARGKKDKAIPRAQRLAKMYCLAVRLILIQKRDDPRINPSWPGIMGMTDWVDEGYDGLESEDDRTICLSHTDFDINIPNAATWANGPIIPEEGGDEPETWPAVVDAHAAVIKEQT
jgi:hypothetical protein